jgi:hypothetical protein
MAPSFVAMLILATHASDKHCVVFHEDLTRTILGNNTINGSGFDTINNVVACSRYKVPIAENLYIALDNLSAHHPEILDSYMCVYPACKLFFQAFKILLPIAGHDSIQIRGSVWDSVLAMYSQDDVQME